MNKDLKQLLLAFITITLISNWLYIYFAKSYFNGICGVVNTVPISCTYFEYIREPVIVITLFWAAILLIVCLLILLVRKLNQYGFYVPSLYYYPNAKWYFTIIYPFIVAPLGLYRFFRALKRWAMNQPTEYPPRKN